MKLLFLTIMRIIPKDIFVSAGVICSCNDDCPGTEDDENGTCILKVGGQCYSAVEEIFNSETRSYEAKRTFGCFSAGEESDSLFQCQGDLVPSHNRRSIKCCNFTDLCNINLILENKPRMRSTPPNNQIDSYQLFAWLSLFCIVVLAFALRLGSKKRSESNEYLTEMPDVESAKTRDIVTRNAECNISSESGAGHPLLIQTTIGREFKRNYLLGRGHFADIYVGDWNGAKIVEKIFTTCNEDRWSREKLVYETAFLRHKNIIGFIGFDVLQAGQRTIYLDYHKNGSLHAYLDHHYLSKREFLTLIKSLMRGVTYLHTEINGTTERPVIAHRNINSKNILINIEKECVISNFEIAVMYSSTKQDIILQPDDTLGNLRYLAPEIVINTSNIPSFESFKMADVYSMGLVLYEICQKYSTEEGVDGHFLPFSNILPEDPSIDDMKNLFQQKPLDVLFIPPRWGTDSVLKSISAIMRECFYVSPMARPNALRLNKTFSAIFDQELKNNEE